ncbi:hypothetical protein B0T17DRAFT_510352 [Bombardia bombarda]|uniref:Uncharacterized protein n=1 Tax=Bombardia bombarda TaxID=252184 RepID=A0AA39WI09_9PEZI|nr:hypothetical protein B0T17DRAFT_510352 [Bombardia bombarda]
METGRELKRGKCTSSYFLRPWVASRTSGPIPRAGADRSRFNQLSPPGENHALADMTFVNGWTLDLLRHPLPTDLLVAIAQNPQLLLHKPFVHIGFQINLLAGVVDGRSGAKLALPTGTAACAVEIVITEGSFLCGIFKTETETLVEVCAAYHPLYPLTQKDKAVCDGVGVRCYE